jgi:hypothetical protein
MTSIVYEPGEKHRSEDFMMRIDRRCIDGLREVIARHPLKPTLRVVVERAIELMIEDLEEEIRRGI